MSGPFRGLPAARAGAQAQWPGSPGLRRRPRGHQGGPGSRATSVSPDPGLRPLLVAGHLDARPWRAVMSPRLGPVLGFCCV